MTPTPPASFEDLLTRGRAAQRSGAPKEAAEAYRAALDLRSDHVATRVALGRVLLAADDPAAAREQLFVAVQHDPDQMVARRLLAEANLALGDDLEAHHWLVEYLGVVRDDDDARRLLAGIEARLRPSPPPETRTLGRLYLEQGHNEQAARVFRTLISAGQDDPELHQLLTRSTGTGSDRKAEHLLAVLKAWDRRLTI